MGGNLLAMDIPVLKVSIKNSLNPVSEFQRGSIKGLAQNTCHLHNIINQDSTRI